MAEANMAEANMAETNSITTTRGIVTAVLACVALIFFIDASAAAPMCRNGICVQVEPIGNPKFVHFRVTAKGGKSSFDVLHSNRRQTDKGGDMTHFPRGTKSTVVRIRHCFASTLGIPVCTKFEEFTLAGFPGQRAEQNVNRQGGDYRNFEVPIERYQSCLEACEADGKCKAYTYVRQGVQRRKSVCWLKDSIPAKDPNRCCVSGVIRQ
jgi:hypothetical protein